MTEEEVLQEKLDTLRNQMDSLQETAVELSKQMTHSPFTMVREFHEHYGMPVGRGLGQIPDERMELRWKLIHEEYLEVSAEIDNVLEHRSTDSLLNLLKELADLVYVVEGFAVELGANLDTVFEEVHRSNMSKLGEDGKPLYRADGKVLKGPNYTEADVAKSLGM